MVGRWNVLLGHGLFSAAFISVSGRVYHVYPTGKRWYPLHLAIFFPEEYGFLHQTANGGTPFRCRTHTIRIQGFWNGSSMGIGVPRAWKFSWSMRLPKFRCRTPNVWFFKNAQPKSSKNTHDVIFAYWKVWNIQYSLHLGLTFLCWWFLKVKSYWFLGQKKTSLPLSGHIRVVNVISAAPFRRPVTCLV